MKISNYLFYVGDTRCFDYKRYIGAESTNILSAG